jgi:surface antigen
MPPFAQSTSQLPADAASQSVEARVASENVLRPRLVACGDNAVMTSRTSQLAASLTLAILLAGFSLAPAARAARAARAGTASLPFQVGLRVSANAKSGAVNLLTVAVSAPTTTSCTLQMSAVRFEKTLTSRRLGSVVWRWRAPKRAPKGVWTFTATCREGASWSASWYKAEMGFPERSGALVGAPAHTPAAGESCDSQGVCFANDPFPVGECTWYAFGRRPDLAGIVHGAAREWLRAAKGRVPEGSRPAVGAIAVYASDAPGTPGHVGYVAAISGSRVLLDDSNWWPTPWSPRLQVHEHWEAASAASGYIYGRPAGAGP